MFRPFWQNQSPFDSEITRLLKVMSDEDPTSEKYSAALDKLTKVHKMKAEECRDRVRLDTFVSAGASLIGVALILHHEKLGVVTSKAMAILPKAK